MTERYERPLSPREVEVMDLVVQGLSSEEIGRYLGCTKSTIDQHRKTAFFKLNAKNAAHAAAIWTRFKLNAA